MNFLKKWFFKPKIKPETITCENHDFSLKKVEKNAQRVLNSLDKCGYDAYLVGGVIRDQLSGIKSKDCDVATNAKPEKIVQKIKGSIIIGRRFRIVHARFGRQIIEISTFRSSSRHISAKGIIKRDNVYGSIEDDVMRRDFTINALYFRYKDQCILDFVGGMDDLKHKRLKSIGDPLERFPEDPVRMIRAVRFTAKLGLTIDDEIISAIKKHKTLLTEVSGQRLFAELIKVYYSGCAESANKLLNEFGLMETLIPGVSKLRRKKDAMLLWHTMAANADKRYKSNRRLSVTYLFACIYWPMMAEKMSKLRMKHFSIKIADEVLSHANIDIPLRVKEDIFEIWKNQYGFKLKEKAPGALLNSKRLRASYELLSQRAMIDSHLTDVALYWETHV